MSIFTGCISSPESDKKIDSNEVSYHQAIRDEPNNLWRSENFAIASCYFSVGFVGSFLTTPLNIYLVETLKVEPDIQNTIGILLSLPWSLKLVFGFLSDAFPIYGMHRKPYLTFGTLLYSLAFITYSISEEHNVVLLGACIFFGTVGLLMYDVMADTLSVERSKFEPEETKGQMQATCYSIRFAGSLIGALLGAALCNRDLWGWGLTFKQVTFVNGLIPFMLIIPWLAFLKEKYKERSLHSDMGSSKSTTTCTPTYSSTEPNSSSSSSTSISAVALPSSADDEESSLLFPSSIAQSHTPSLSITAAVAHIDSFELVMERTRAPLDPTHSVRAQIQEIWETVQLKAVWRPMAFVYIYNILQVPNVAWQSYLQLCLHFEPWILGLTVTLGSFMTLVGALAYKYYYFNASWRAIYAWSTVLTAFFSLMQLILIFQINTRFLHLSNYLFSLGDDVITAYISGIQFIPICIMYMRLCPDGSEGASYAMLTTFGNIALVCASSIGSHLAHIWDVSNEAMASQNTSGLWKLTVLTSCLSLSPLLLLHLLPQDAQEQMDLAKSKQKSAIGGFVFLAVLFVSLGWTITSSIYKLISI